MTGSGASSRTPSVRRQNPQSRSSRSGSRKTASRRRKGWGWKVRLILLSGLVVLGLAGWATLARKLAPTSNTSLTHFDTIIVLGAPADDDGNPTPTELARVTEAVHEYERGVAPRIIFTGGATNLHFVEAQVMARTAEAQGIPEQAVFVEGQARDTIHNACYSMRIMQAHGWHSAEVISSDFHLPRAGMIFDRLPIEWRAHAAPAVEPASPFRAVVTPLIETLSTIRYLVWAREWERCEP